MPVEATVETKIEAAVEVAKEIPPQEAVDSDWEPPMPPTDLIFDDGKPLESPLHRIGINVLIRLLLVAYVDCNDYYVGGNMFIYFSRAQVKNLDYRGPDFFVVLDVDGTHSRQGLRKQRGPYLPQDDGGMPANSRAMPDGGTWTY